MRRLCATVLIFEVVVIGLAIPVAITIAHAKPVQAGVVGGVLAVAALVIAGLVGRPGQGWTLVGGTVLQVAVIATAAACSTVPPARVQPCPGLPTRPAI